MDGHDDPSWEESEEDEDSSTVTRGRVGSASVTHLKCQTIL